MKYSLLVLLILSNFSGHLSEIHFEFPLSNFPAFGVNTAPGKEKSSSTGSEDLEFESLSGDEKLKTLTSTFQLNNIFGRYTRRSFIQGIVSVYLIKIAITSLLLKTKVRPKRQKKITPRKN
jgi:hypothetical protein